MGARTRWGQLAAAVGCLATMTTMAAVASPTLAGAQEVDFSVVYDSPPTLTATVGEPFTQSGTGCLLEDGRPGVVFLTFATMDEPQVGGTITDYLPARPN